MTEIIKNFLNKNSTRIFLISFLVLFCELTLIRWINSSIISVSFYSNIIMLASFFGIGIGCVLKIKRNLFDSFPTLILILTITLFISSLGVISINNPQNQDIMFQSNMGFYKIPSWLIIMIIFSYLTALFAPLGQKLKLAFQDSKKSIDAYIFDLFGSLVGIITFSALGYFEMGLNYWILIIALASIAIQDSATNIKTNNLIIWAFIFSIIIFQKSSDPNSWWSKYYFITLEEIQKDKDYLITTDRTGHQAIKRDISKGRWFYEVPYKYFNNSPYEDVLIIGAGSGQDLSVALKNNAKNIDAVDIEPKLVELGKKFHPLKPYDDKRINIHIADGRNFIENQKNKTYDIIIFALTDSLKLASSNTNTRLESYLFTLESFTKAKSLLKEDGMIILYNYYRKEWLVEKLTHMLAEVFDDKVISINKKPKNITSGSLIIAGNGIKNFNQQKLLANNEFEIQYKTKESNQLNNYSSNDNWPFIYLFKPSIPNSYLYIISFILLLNIAVISLFLRQHKQEKENIELGWRDFLKTIPWHLFFLGAGFMLLETKNIINFQLLFGSTWLVNSLVFTAIISLALISAILVKMKLVINKKILYILMAISIVLSILVPLKSIIELPFYAKYLLAIAISLLPIFFANLIFSSHFSKQNNSYISFGLNMVGALIGGLLEYISMLKGYHFLLYLIGICYFLAIIFAENFYKNSSKNNLN